MTVDGVSPRPLRPLCETTTILFKLYDTKALGDV